jgi:hypothetical protein
MGAGIFAASALAQVPPSAYANFEGSQTNPIRLSADGTRLFAVNTAAANIDLIAKGTINGQIHGLLFQAVSNNFTTDTTGLGPFTALQLGAKILAGDTLTFMGCLPVPE